MLTFPILVHDINAAQLSSPNSISLTNFLENSSEYAFFNRSARILSLLSNIILWLSFLFTIVVLQIGRHDLSTTTKILFGFTMLCIIIICYIFILFESRGCTEQILLKNCMHLNFIKRELGLLQKNTKLNYYLSVKATNYYNSFRQKYIDYQAYERSLCERLQSSFYRNIRSVESSFNIRQYYITVPDFSIDKNHLCQILFQYNLKIIGRDANIVYDDMKNEFQRLENDLLNATDDSMNKLVHFQRYIYFQRQDKNQQDLLFGKQRTYLVYENKTNVYFRWFLNENSFWIMTCIGLSWLFRALFTRLIAKIVVPVYIELEGAMPLQTFIMNHEKKLIQEKLLNKI